VTFEFEADGEEWKPLDRLPEPARRMRTVTLCATLAVQHCVAAFASLGAAIKSINDFHEIRNDADAEAFWG
jgi:hypothetical protein